MLNDTKWTFGNARPKRTWWKTMAIVAACGATSACDSATEVLRLDEIRLDPAIIQLNPGDAVVVEAILTDQPSGGVSGSALVTVTPHVPPRPPPDLPLRAPGG
jgi:hypothetical protein